MKRLFFAIAIVSVIFFSACADNKEAPEGEGSPGLSVTKEPEPSAAGAFTPEPSATEAPTPEPSATETPMPKPSATEAPMPSKEEIANEKVVQKIWEAFEEVRTDKAYQKEFWFQELALESRGSLHIAMITRKPVTRTEKQTYQGKGRVYLAFYDESKDEGPYFLCKSFGSLFEADIFGDEEGMYLSLITMHGFAGVEFYDMSSFCFSKEGCFEAVFAEDSLTYWRDRKPEFEESKTVKLYQRRIRKAFFYHCLLNEADLVSHGGKPSYSWEYEEDIDLSQLAFDQPASVRILKEDTVLADVANMETFPGWDGDWEDGRDMMLADPLRMPDGSILVVCKVVAYIKYDNVAILLYDSEGNLLDHMYYAEQYARIARNAEQSYFEIHAWQSSQGWEQVDLSGKVRAENGKIVIEPDEEQGKTYVEDMIIPID